MSGVSNLEPRVMSQQSLIWRMAGSMFALLYDLGRSSLVCPISGCDVVQASPYSKWFGLPVAGFGFAYFSGLFALSLYGVFSNVLIGYQISDLLCLSSAPGLVFYTYFTYLEAFVIHAWCFWCVTSSLMLVGFFVCALLEGRKPKQV
jgi:uncharacterized membrane protein